MPKSKLLVFFIIALVLLYLYPLLKAIPSSFPISLILQDKDGFASAMGRSFLFAFSSSTIAVVLGLMGAVFLSRISLSSSINKLLSILIVPITLGNISTAFIFKLILADTRLFNNIIISNGVYEKYGLLLIIQCWQFGTLFLYLFWLNIQNIPKSLSEYAIATKLGAWQKFKDIILPNCRNLAVLLFIIGFIFSLYEDAKIQFVFKASQGTNSELINHWLFRTYQSNLLINPDFAITDIFKIGYFVLLLNMVIIVLLIYSVNITIQKISKTRISTRKFGNPFSLKRHYFVKPKYAGILMVSIVFLPIALSFLKLHIRFSKELMEMWNPLVLTLLAASSATSVAIIFAVSSRIGWNRLLKDFNSRSIYFFLFLFVLHLLPPICVLTAGFKWMKIMGYSSSVSVNLIWIIGHSILFLPLLGSFLLSSHFRVSNLELEYLSAYRIKFKEVVRYSFLKRFKTEYLFTFIIAYSFVWNEGLINRILSDRIPSFASRLEMMITGRAADYSKAFGYLMISVLVAFASVCVWNVIMGKTRKKIESQ